MTETYEDQDGTNTQIYRTLYHIWY